MPVFVLVFIWIFVSALYVAQTSPMLFRYVNAKTDFIVPVVGFVISIAGLVLESLADKQKGDQKKERPDMVATKGLYKMVRCPNYLGEVTIWTGALLSAIGAGLNWWQWLIVAIGYAGIVFVMFSGARRLELRQNASYGNDPEYQAYVKKTPILIPFLPIYSVAKYEWLKA
jgi:steroid 5-alpha reductase family enzyme